ncbi:hypothetical protein B0H13DRAFT_1855526 [Mycena leptocephala]|nr:hypothetical protein B0H13DRAFT_1855526 [Mycena leptocephala]
MAGNLLEPSLTLAGSRKRGRLGLAKSVESEIPVENTVSKIRSVARRPAKLDSQTRGMMIRSMLSCYQLEGQTNLCLQLLPYEKAPAMKTARTESPSSNEIRRNFHNDNLSVSWPGPSFQRTDLFEVRETPTSDHELTTDIVWEGEVGYVEEFGNVNQLSLHFLKKTRPQIREAYSVLTRARLLPGPHTAPHVKLCMAALTNSIQPKSKPPKRTARKSLTVSKDVGANDSDAEGAPDDDKIDYSSWTIGSPDMGLIQVREAAPGPLASFHDPSSPATPHPFHLPPTEMVRGPAAPGTPAGGEPRHSSRIKQPSKLDVPVYDFVSQMRKPCQSNVGKPKRAGKRKAAPNGDGTEPATDDKAPLAKKNSGQISEERLDRVLVPLSLTTQTMFFAYTYTITGSFFVPPGTDLAKPTNFISPIKIWQIYCEMRNHRGYLRGRSTQNIRMEHERRDVRKDALQFYREIR